jgi:hypothetical protein
MGSRWLAVLVLAGCEHVFDVHAVAVQDATSICGAPTLLCADFDEPEAIVYEGGFATALPAAIGNISVMRHPPGTSRPNALYLDANVGGYFHIVPVGTANATSITATFDIEFERGPVAEPARIVELELKNPAAFDHCYAEFELDNSSNNPLIMTTHAQATPTSMDVHPTVTVLAGMPAPGRFLHVTFVLDAANQIASTQIDQMPPVMVSLGVPQVAAGGMPDAEVGAINPHTDGAFSGPGPAFALDNVVVTTAP